MNACPDPRPLILHVIDHLEGGGAQRQLQALIRQSDKTLFRYAILYLTAGPSGAEFPEGTNLIRVPRGGKWNLAAFWRRVYRAVLDSRPDLLHLWMPEVMTIPAALAGRALKIPILSSQRRSMHGMPTLRKKLRDRLGNIQHLLSDRVVTNFPVLEEPFLFSHLYRKKGGQVIPNGIQLTCDRPPAGPPVDRKENSFLLWYTGRIVPQKRVDLLLEAFLDLRREGLALSLVICGNDQLGLEEKWRKRLREHHAEHEIRFIGYRPDWHRLVGQADLFVLPSVSEGMPNVLFEAMLAGCCVTASDIPVIRHFLTHQQQGWLCRPNSLESLKESIRALYADPALRARMARQGKELAASLSVEKMAASYETLYRELLEKPNPHNPVGRRSHD